MSEDNDKFPVNVDQADDTTEVRIDSTTHIGVERKSGGWLENETEKILKFAGFKTQREARVIFEESTNEHYRVDILATFEDLILFVECKDYTETKINEKILFTLIGQVNDYRRNHPDNIVIGVLVTSAKNLGQNRGIDNKLQSKGCSLWDGITLQHLQDKMLEVNKKSEFAEHLFGLLGVLSDLGLSDKSKLKSDEHKIYCRMTFISIPKHEYIGNKFSQTSIYADLKDVLDGTGIVITALSYNEINHNADLRLRLTVDFDKIFTDEKLRLHWNKKSKWFKKPKETPLELMEIDFKEACKVVIRKTYGVEINLPDEMPIHCITTRTE